MKIESVVKVGQLFIKEGDLEMSIIPSTIENIVNKKRRVRKFKTKNESYFAGEGAD